MLAALHALDPTALASTLGSLVPDLLTALNALDPQTLAHEGAALEDEIKFQGADTIAAFIAEPVLGAGGVVVPPAGFMKKVRALLDRHDILMIADEVITGFGRTGEWFGVRLDGFAPDIMCIAKAITSGYFPLGACVVNEKIEDLTKFVAAKRSKWASRYANAQRDNNQKEMDAVRNEVEAWNARVISEGRPQLQVSLAGALRERGRPRRPSKPMRGLANELKGLYE